MVRFKEHTGGKHPNFAVIEHTSITGHQYILADVKVLVKGNRDLKRKVKKAIHKNKPALNRNRDHEIPAIFFQLVSYNCSDYVMK